MATVQLSLLNRLFSTILPLSQMYYNIAYIWADAHIQRLQVIVVIVCEHDKCSWIKYGKPPFEMMWLKANGKQWIYHLWRHFCWLVLDKWFFHQLQMKAKQCNFVCCLFMEIIQFTAVWRNDELNTQLSMSSNKIFSVDWIHQNTFKYSHWFVVACPEIIYSVYSTIPWEKKHVNFIYFNVIWHFNSRNRTTTKSQ